MSKKRAFISGSHQIPTHIRKATLNYDVLVEGKSDANTIVVAEYIKSYENFVGMSASQHFVPINLLSGAGKGSFIVAKPDADLNLPEIGQKLLPFILPKKLRANVAGDLAEDFRTYATRWGRPYALRWLWWELAGVCIHRFGPSAIITGVGLWFRQKIGW